MLKKEHPSSFQKKRRAVEEPARQLNREHQRFPPLKLLRWREPLMVLNREQARFLTLKVLQKNPGRKPRRTTLGRRKATELRPCSPTMRLEKNWVKEALVLCTKGNASPMAYRFCSPLTFVFEQPSDRYLQKHKCTSL
ncbi:hypothetical protein NFI96_018851 [Prochilodus magdalenae]|nr:hypothetical protein NFI96_018851 [Prochilodus magdalenae]